MGLAKSIIASVAVILVFGTGIAAEASTLQGVQAFKRGKYAEALKQLEPEVQKGDAEAMYVLGKMYAAGQGVGKDEKKAAGLFAKAADLGNAQAQQALGSALMLGEGIEQNMEEALKWFIISARAGNNDAQAYAGRVARFMTRQQRLDVRKRALAWQKAYQQKKGGAAK